MQDNKIRSRLKAQLTSPRIAIERFEIDFLTFGVTESSAGGSAEVISLSSIHDSGAHGSSRA